MTGKVWKRAAFTVFLIVASLIGLAGLTVLSWVFYPPLRTTAVQRGLAQADRSLPGKFAHADVRSSHSGAVEVRNFRWFGEGDTLLVQTDALRLDLDVDALFGRNLRVKTLRADSLYLDLPALQRTLASMPKKEPKPKPASSEEGGGIPFLNPGVLQGVPSLVVDELIVGLDRVRVSDTVVLRGRVDLSADLSTAGGGAFALKADIRGDRPTDPRLTSDLSLHLLNATAQGQAEVQLAEDWKAQLELSSPQPRTIRLQLTDSVAGVRGLDANLNFVIERKSPTELTATNIDGGIEIPGVDVLRQRPPLRDLPELPLKSATQAQIEGRIELEGTPSYQAKLSLGSNELWNAVQVDGRFSEGRWELRESEVDARGLKLEASGAGDSETMDVGVQAWADSFTFLEPWMPSPPQTEDLQVAAQARITGTSNKPGLALSLNGSGTINGAELNDARLRADTDRLTETPLDLWVGLVSQDLQADVRGELAADFQSLRTAPLRVLSRPGARKVLAVSGLDAAVPMTGPVSRPSYPALGGAANPARIAWASGVEVRGLRVVGDLGRVLADLTVAESGDLTANFDAQWPTAPKILSDRLELRPGLADTLRQAWGRDGPFKVSGNVQGTGETMAGRLRLDLPGPHTLASLLPDSSNTEGLGSIRGSADFRQSKDQLNLVAHLAGEAWLDSLYANVSQVGEEWAVERAELSVLGAHLEGGGNWGRNNNLLFELRMADLDRLKSVFPKPTAGLSASVDGTVVVGGSADNPQLEVAMTGSAGREAQEGGEPLAIEAWTLRAQRDSSRLDADLDLPTGVTGLPLVVSSAELSLSSASSSGLPVDLSFRAEGPELAASADIWVESAATDSSESVWRIRGDALDVVVRGRSLSSREVFQLVVDPAAQRYQVADLRLEGDIGSLTMDGVLQPMDSDLEATADLRLPERPEELELPDWAWAERVRMDFRVQGTSGLNLDLLMEGVPWTKTPLDAQAQIRTEAERFVLSAFVTQEDDSLLTVKGAAPGSVQILPTRVEGGDGPVELLVDLKEFPVPVPARDQEEPEQMILSGQMLADGLASAPQFQGDFEATFPDWPEMSQLRAVATARYASESGVAAIRLAALKRNGSPASADSLVVGTARVPVALSLYPVSLELPEDADISARLSADKLNLQEFEPLLPSDFSVRGQATVSLKVDGPRDNPNLEGAIRATALEAKLADGSRVAASSRLNLSGSLLRPRVTGKVDVASGLLVVPEAKKDLLPAEGSSRLLELRVSERGTVYGPANRDGSVSSPSGSANRDSSFVAPTGSAHRDSTVAASSGQTSGAAINPAEIVPDLDVTIDIPGAVWIRGRGLEVELEGSLRATYEEVPVLTGTLEARSGHFRLLGRYFEIQSGVVGFYGEPEIDPDLDLVLQARVDETQVFVEVTGTALSPQLRLRSEPQMEEGDILSLLLLGRTLDQLDDDQTELLESRAADVAAGFGATQLGARLSGQLGVDLVSVQQGSQPNSGNALVIGKYLSPRILLKYEQALQSSADFLVNLEYLLTRHLRLETFYGPRSQSGVEFNWISEY